MTTHARYADKFLNALMDPHHIFLKALLYYNDAPLEGELPLVSGSVSADRNGNIQRTAHLTIDPNVVNDPVYAPRLNPYGSIVKIWRGIRYPDGSVDPIQVFTGRIDAVSKSLDGLSLECSDLAARVLDARFTKPFTLPRDQNINTVAGDLIKACWPVLSPPTVTTDTATDQLTKPGQTFEQERGDALNSLMKTIGSEWFADPTGVFHLRKLPAVVTVGTEPTWIIDSGDSGVLISNVVDTNRQNVANYIVVDGEPVGGTVGAHGEWKDENDESVTWIGGPYGVVTAFFSGQAVSTSAANTLAAQLGANSIAKTEQVQVSCVPNPKLALGDVVRVLSPRLGLDKMYFVQSFDLPLDPETPMTMTLHQTLLPAAATREGMTVFEPSPLRVPEGCTWQPHR